MSFSDPIEGAKALREMDGKYIGNRPCKLKKSSWTVSHENLTSPCLSRSMSDPSQLQCNFLMSAAKVGPGLQERVCALTMWVSELDYHRQLAGTSPFSVVFC